MVQIVNDVRSRVRSMTGMLVPVMLLASLLAACEGRRQQGTQYGGTQPVPGPATNTNPQVTPGATPGSGDVPKEQGNAGEADGTEVVPDNTGLSADELAKGKAYVNGWDGLQDEIPADSNWSIANTSVTTAPPSGGGTVPPSGGDTSVVAYEGTISSLMTANCTSCHRQGGSRANSPLTTYAEVKGRGADLVSRVVAGTMPTGAPLSQADKDKFTAWQKGGFAEKSGSGGSTVPGGDTASGSPTLEITDQRYGDYLNEKEIVGKVGQTLKIVNKRQSGGFTIHTNGAPFPHGDGPIPPGGSVELKFLSPYSGDSDIYEHTDGSVNLDRKIKLRVTQ